MNIERKRPGRPAGPSDTRERILDSARNLFARNGLDITSIRAIAKDAGVDPALVHHYFGTKDALFLAAVDALASEIWQGVPESYVGLLADAAGDSFFSWTMVQGTGPSSESYVSPVSASLNLRRIQVKAQRCMPAWLPPAGSRPPA